MRKADEIIQAIHTEMERMTIIDAHEHLPPEAERIAAGADALTLFSHYCKGDLTAVGVKPDEMNFIFNRNESIFERWRRFKPYYAMIENTAYVRAAHIAMEKFYGESLVTDGNVEILSERIQAANKPGLYRRVLRDTCKIETCLNQWPSELLSESDSDLLTVVSWDMHHRRQKDIREHDAVLGREVKTLDDLLEAAQVHVQKIKSSGAVGYKFFVFPMDKPCRSDAQKAFESIMADESIELPQENALNNLYYDTVLREIQKLDLVACVHTGYWGDFRKLHPSHALYMLDAYPDVKFDLYHVGYPYVRDAIMIGKTRGNVWMNMCWTYIISPHFAGDALTEMLEMVPIGKIIGFGGDYSVVEKVYSHLVLARQVIAKALAGKVLDGSFTLVKAIDMARQMLYATPKKLYNL